MGSLTLLRKFALLSFLCILGITVAVCAAGAEFFSRHLVRHDATVVGDLATILITRSVPVSYFTHPATADASIYERTVAQIVPTVDVVRTILYDARGLVLWSDDAGLIGRRFPDNRELHEALEGAVEAHIIRPGKEEHEGSLRAFERLEEIYLPIRYERDGPIVGALEIYRNPPAFFAALDRAYVLVWVLGGGGGLLLYVALFGVVRRAARRQLKLEGELVAHANTLESRVAERTRELWLLYETSTRLQATGDVSHVASAIAEGAVELTDAGWGAVARRAGSQILLDATAGAPPPPAGDGDLACSRRIADAYRTGEPERDGLLCVPLKRKDEILGVVVVGDKRDGAAFTEHDQRLLTTFARHAAAVLENTHLFQQVIRTERLAATGLLAAGVAHEIGNPLTCISSLAQLVGPRVGDPALRRDLDDIQLHAARIERMLNDLTRLTQSGAAALSRTPLNDTVQDAVTLARHNPAVRRTPVHVVLDPAAPMVSAVPDKLLQVFLNLTLNAVDAGGELTIRTLADGAVARVTFTDSGRGMSADELRRAFDPFFSTKGTDQHMGLGLFVSHEIIRQHGGTILAQSCPGAGSTFTVVLPRES